MAHAVASNNAPPRNWFDDVLVHWLGYAVPPASTAITAAGFCPDRPDAYCWRCGDSAGPGEVTSTGCASCRDRAAIADRVVRLGPYVDALRDWILAIKYERWALMGQQLGGMLGDAVARTVTIDPDNTVVVPMPMPWQRRIYRGIDHAHIIAAAAARRLRVPVVPMLTKRHGPPQVCLSPTERQRLGGRNIRLRRRLGGWDLTGAHVILVDDVRTTGATMRRTVRLLRDLASPPKTITAAILAVADPASRRARQQAGADGDLIAGEQ